MSLRKLSSCVAGGTNILLHDGYFNEYPARIDDPNNFKAIAHYDLIGSELTHTMTNAWQNVDPLYTAANKGGINKTKVYPIILVKFTPAILVDLNVYSGPSQLDRNRNYNCQQDADVFCLTCTPWHPLVSRDLVLAADDPFVWPAASFMTGDNVGTLAGIGKLTNPVTHSNPGGREVYGISAGTEDEAKRFRPLIPQFVLHLVARVVLSGSLKFDGEGNFELNQGFSRDEVDSALLEVVLSWRTMLNIIEEPRRYYCLEEALVLTEEEIRTIKYLIELNDRFLKDGFNVEAFEEFLERRTNVSNVLFKVATINFSDLYGLTGIDHLVYSNEIISGTIAIQHRMIRAMQLTTLKKLAP
jgi:hypothetical protein